MLIAFAVSLSRVQNQHLCSKSTSKGRGLLQFTAVLWFEEEKWNLSLEVKIKRKWVILVLLLIRPCSQNEHTRPATHNTCLPL